MQTRSRFVFVTTLTLCGLVACSSDPDVTSDSGSDVEVDIGVDVAPDVVADVPTDAGEVICGDGIIVGPYEQCEPSVTFVCSDIGFAYGLAACGSDCIADTSGCSVVPICGDGETNGDEECDDGGRVDGDGCNADCGVERCGDGEVNGTEECDGDRAIACSDGSLGVLACTDDCAIGANTCLEAGTCGDGIIDADEACDDGNTIPGDGCDASCRAETCGDGVRQGQERCDGNDLGDASCQSLGFDAGTLYCSGACRLDTERCVVAVCGDGVQDAGEACDDGNRVSGDGCSRNCVIERCGDGRANVGIGEQCDGIDVQGLTCADFGFTLARLSCGLDCRVDLSGCERLPQCGDGTVDTNLGESCDDGNEVSNDGCSVSCLSETCGDGVVQSSETCEPGIAPTTSCLDQGYLAGRMRCSAACELDESSCVAAGCGNGLLEDGEQCDGLLSTAACLDEGYDFGRLDCTDECTFEPDGCRFLAVCGDGVRAGAEECDDGNNTDGDGCSLDCVVEDCGDGIVQPALEEQCEGTGRSITLGCGPEGQDVGTVSCASSCQFEPVVCFERECGNGVIEVGEACDDGNRDDGDGCASDCVSETCGDGTQQLYEACDGGPGAVSCEDIDVIGGTVGCDACVLDYSNCGTGAPVCGNGVHERGEECDLGDLNSDVADTCRTDCSLPTCGDGIVDTASGETCDPGLDVDCPDYCVAIDDAFLVPDDGTLADGVASPFDLILILEDVSETVVIPRDVVIRGVSDDVVLSGFGTDILATTEEASLTLQNLTVYSTGDGTRSVSATGDLTLEGVTMVAEEEGACIAHAGQVLSVSDSSFVGCTIQRAGEEPIARGGAIDSAATDVAIVRTSFVDSTVLDADEAFGGAISLRPEADDYTISIVDVHIRGSIVRTSLDGTHAAGGGIDIEPVAGAFNGTVDIDGLAVIDSFVTALGDPGTASGGAVSIRLTRGYAVEDGPRHLILNARNLWISGNTVAAPNTIGSISSGGGVALVASVGSIDARFEDFEVANNRVESLVTTVGGGFFFEANGMDSSTTVSVERGLIVGNETFASSSVAYGGGLGARAVLSGTSEVTVTNVTLTENSARLGGGISVETDTSDPQSPLHLNARHITVAANDALIDGGGLYAIGAGTTTQLSASIIDTNAVGGDTTALGAQCGYPPDAATTFTENNVGPAGECEFDDTTDSDPDGAVVLAPLANNGSSVRTMLPLMGARDLFDGCDADGEVIAEDQRGLGRPVGLCDAGAAEAQIGE